MKLCFPVKEARGLMSELSGHFGSAPVFMVVDSESGGHEAVVNENAVHARGMCNPAGAIAGLGVEAAVVSGIGQGAINRLSLMGVRVFRAGARTVGENLELFRLGRLAPYEPSMACGGHGGGCSHH